MQAHSMAQQPGGMHANPGTAEGGFDYVTPHVATHGCHSQSQRHAEPDDCLIQDRGGGGSGHAKTSAEAVHLVRSPQLSSKSCEPGADSHTAVALLAMTVRACRRQPPMPFGVVARGQQLGAYLCDRIAFVISAVAALSGAHTSRLALLQSWVRGCPVHDTCRRITPSWRQ